MKPRTMAVPMSGWARMSTQAKPVTMSSGPMIRRSAASSSRRRVMKSAANRVRASFISSDGCRRNCPKPTQRLDPMACTPRPGTSTTKSRRERHQHDQRAEAPQLAVVEADGQPQDDGADRHPHGLPDEDGPRRAVGGDGDDRGRRAHHDEPDDAEQDDVEQQQRRDRNAVAADADAETLGVGRPAVRHRALTGGGRLRPRGRSPAGPGRRVPLRRGDAAGSTSWRPPPLGAGAPLCPVRHPMHAASLPHRATEVADRGHGPATDARVGTAGDHVNFATVRKSP